MTKKSKNKYYVVWHGQNPGVYNTWAECQLQIKGFPNAKYKSFKSKEQALEAYGGSALNYISEKRNKKTTPKLDFKEFENEILKESISVDAACSGNPGVMEYRAVDTFSGIEIFKMGPFNGGTNNVGEFLALIHALALLKKKGDSDTTIYTDSRTALSWLKKKKVKTTLKQTKSNQSIFIILSKAIKWLENNEIRNPIIKWNTKKWGEIPADFGRK